MTSAIYTEKKLSILYDKALPICPISTYSHQNGGRKGMQQDMDTPKNVIRVTGMQIIPHCCLSLLLPRNIKTKTQSPDLIQKKSLSSTALLPAV